MRSAVSIPPLRRQRGIARCRKCRRRVPASAVPASDVGGTRRRSIVRRRVVPLLGLHLGIELVHALGVARQRGRRHRAVDEDRQHRDAILRLEPPQPIEQLFDAADRERRDDQLAAALEPSSARSRPAARRRRPARARDRRRWTRPAGSRPRSTGVGSGSTGRPKRPRSPPKRIVRPSMCMRTYDDRAGGRR